MYLRTVGDYEGNAANKSEVSLQRFESNEKLLTSFICSPTKLLRSFPPLQAKLIVEITVSNLRKIPADIYDELVHHAE